MILCSTDATSAILGDKTAVEVTSPVPLPAGVYGLVCGFTGTKPKSVTAKGNITVLDVRTTEITAITAPVVKVGDNSKLVVNGIGFHASPQLQCYYGDKNTPMKTTFISANKIQCSLEAFMTKEPKTSQVFLSFASFDIKRFSVEHHVGLGVPDIQSARFSEKLNQIIITFTGIVRAKDETDKNLLARIFPRNHTSFGDKASLKFIANQLIVSLLGSPTVIPGNLIINPKNLRSGADLTIYGDEDEVVVILQGPENPVNPVVQLIGSTVVGKC